MKRIITGMIAGIAWLLLLFSGSFLLFGLVIAVIGAVAIHEYCAATIKPLGDSKGFAAVVPGLLPLLAALTGRLELVTAGLVAALLFIIAETFKRYSTLENPYEHMAKLSLGVLLIGFSCAHFTLIWRLPDGHLWLLLLTAITIASDTMAYYTGRLLGKHKLCPAISPGKTVEGFVGGLAGGVAAALLVALNFLPEFELWKVGVIAAVLSCIGVAGDLTESIIKRAAGIKDSGTILPGHGGVLDRIDSLLLTAPVLYYLLSLNIAGGTIAAG